MFNNDNRETEFKTMMPKLYGDWGVVPKWASSEQCS